MNESVIDNTDRIRALYLHSDLLPCPFCGGNAISVGRINAKAGNFVAQIMCPKCVLTMVVCLKADKADMARQEVKEKWNRRIND
jgi:Lar family restriction alleviation protein